MDWSIFKSQALEEHTAAVLAYIKHCTDTVISGKCIWVSANQKPWMTRKLNILLKERETAFRSGDVEWYSEARASLKRDIQQAKSNYKRKIEDYLHSNNTRQV